MEQNRTSYPFYIYDAITGRILKRGSVSSKEEVQIQAYRPGHVVREGVLPPEVKSIDPVSGDLVYKSPDIEAAKADVEIREVLLNALDKAGDDIVRTKATLSPRKARMYEIKKAEAQRVIAAKGKPLQLARQENPVLAKESELTGTSLEQLAETVIAKSEESDRVIQDVDALTVLGKKKLREAGAKELHSVFEDFVQRLEALKRS